MNKLQSYLGIGLLILSIFGFVLMILLGVVSNENDLATRADILPNLKGDFLTNENELTSKILNLRVPTDIPVSVSNDNVGRESVFKQY